MVVVLRLNHREVAIFKKSYDFFVAIEGKTLEIPFPTYREAYDWVKRVTQNHCEKQSDVRPDQGR